MTDKRIALSVIIPTLNEAENIVSLLIYLESQLKDVSHELIVSDAGSTDQTRQLASKNGALVINCERMSRAYQMNEGAKKSRGELLYFVHADAIPPKGFFKDIKTAMNEGVDFGCFRFKFDSNRFLLSVNSYFTRFDSIVFRGGDQSLFISKLLFDKLNGFCDHYRIMEEYEFILRARKKYKFKIIPRDLIVSARKYEENSYLRVNFANFVVFSMFRFGASQAKMVSVYNKLLKHPKVESLQAE